MSTDVTSQPAQAQAAHASVPEPEKAAPTYAPGTNDSAPTTNGHAAGGQHFENEKPHVPQIDTSAQPPAGQQSAPQTAHTAQTSQPAAAASPMSSKSPKQIKADLKNEKAYAKVLNTKSAAEGKELKAAIKDGQQATKTDDHAAQQEFKAKKALDKAVKNEYKLNKKLVDIKAKYDAAVVALEQAKAKMELKQSHHQTTTALRDEKLNQIEDLKRRSMLSNPTSPTTA